MGRLKCDYIKWLITLTCDHIKSLSLVTLSLLCEWWILCVTSFLCLTQTPDPGPTPPNLEDLEFEAFKMLTDSLLKMGIPTLNPDFRLKLQKEMHVKYLNILIMDLRDHVCIK